MQLFAMALHGAASIAVGLLLVVGAVSATLVAFIYGALAAAARIEPEMADEMVAALGAYPGAGQALAIAKILGVTFIAWMLYRIGSDELAKWGDGEPDEDGAPDMARADRSMPMGVAPNKPSERMQA